MDLKEFLGPFGYLITLFLALWLIFKSKRKLPNGYMSRGSHGLSKIYNKTEVQFHHWGSTDSSADGNDSYLGFWGVIKSLIEIPPHSIESFFDEIESDRTGDGKYLVIVKKRKVFVGTEAFYNFLNRFDRLILTIEANEV